MGKALKNMSRSIKLALKTVTFHWKQYVCFFIAMLAMQAMFGIIVMSTSKSLEDYSNTVNSQYSYHFAITNISASQRKSIAQRVPKNYSPYIVSDEDGFLYVTIDKYYDTENGSQNKSLEYYYDSFVEKYVNKTTVNDLNASEISYLMSPLYNLENKAFDLWLECAIKLLVLALVSIAVIILLLNIRLNHFKFTYGIYMSYGADAKKLFSTNFWDMLMVGLLTYIPASAASIFLTFFLFAPESGFAIGELPKFLISQGLLVLFGLLFLIPVCIIAVLIPTKLIAKQPPLKLLMAQDNSNLVSSPRISSQLFGKKFPGAYEGLGLFRFRRYIATVVASSVLFSAIFVWISFFANIYDFNTKQEQAEFTVNVNSQMEVVEEYVIKGENKDKDVTSKFEDLRDKIYIKSAYNKDNVEKVVIFESYYNVDYKFVWDKDGNVSKVTDRAGNDVTSAYWEARRAIVTDSYKDRYFGNNQVGKNNFKKFEEYLLDGRDSRGNNISSIKYYNDTSSVNGTVRAVYEKTKVTSYTYPENSIKTQRTKISDLELLLAGTGCPILKRVEFDLFRPENTEHVKDDIIFKSNYVYASFFDDNVKAFSGIEYNRHIGMRVTDRLEIAPLDSANLNFLNQKYEMDIMNGDEDITLDSLRSGSSSVKYVIISETAANSQVLDIKPGDKIYLNSLVERKGDYDSTLSGDSLLRALISGETFTTEEFTVFAVIKNMPTSEMLPIYLLETDYTRVTGVNAIPNQFQIYVPAAKSSSEIDKLYIDLAKWGENGYANVVWNNAVAENREVLEMNTLPVVQTIAIFALILSPLFWFFSQIMFYGKREDEFTLLRGLGATEREIRKIFRKDGAVFAAIGVVATVILGIIGVYVIHKLNMLYVAFFDNDAITLFRFEMPWIAILIACAVTAFCGYVSTVLPYYLNRRKARKTLNNEYGE